MKTGLELIAEERQRQIEVEGFSKESDRGYTNGELATAAACYAITPTGTNVGEIIKRLWPFHMSCFKPAKGKFPESRINELSKAGALIVAEIDRLQLINK